MHQVRHGRGSAVAFFAALMLVVQSFLSAWASGALAAAPVRDAFGNPLCITSVDHDGTTPADDHAKMPDCCTSGCSMGSFPLVAASGAGIGLLRSSLSDDVRFDAIAAFHIQRPDHDPGTPRAPPVTA